MKPYPVGELKIRSDHLCRMVVIDTETGKIMRPQYGSRDYFLTKESKQRWRLVAASQSTQEEALVILCDAIKQHIDYKTR